MVQVLSCHQLWYYFFFYFIFSICSFILFLAYCKPPQMGAFLFLVFFSLLLASLFLLLATPRMRCSWAAKDMIESERKRSMGEPFLGSKEDWEWAIFGWPDGIESRKKRQLMRSCFRKRGHNRLKRRETTKWKDGSYRESWQFLGS